MTWISPRGTLDVMDDLQPVGADQDGLLQHAGHRPQLSPGDASGNLPQVAARPTATWATRHRACSPSSVEAGVPVHLDLGAVSGPGLRLRASRQEQDHAPAPAEREDDRPVHGSAGRAIVNPMLAEVGVNPKSVKYRAVRPAVGAGGRPRAGRRRAGLGRPARAAGRSVGDLRLGVRRSSSWSARSGARRVRRTPMWCGRPTSQDSAKRDLYTPLLRQGSVMGSEFARRRTRALRRRSPTALARCCRS